MREPRLRNPLMLCAFSGWNDAGDAATLALQTLADQWSAQPFASIDPEVFTDFTQVRPQVRLPDGVNRVIAWPEHQFLSASVSGSHRDVILLIGPEPQLRWRTFCRQVISVAERLGADLMVSLGALLSNVSHRSSVPVLGTATSLDLLDRYGLQRSSYEGPTGIVGVLHGAAQQSGLSSASLWATVPSYLSQVSSPKAALALVNRVAELIDVPIEPVALQVATATYVQQVEDAVARDESLQEMVAGLDAEADDDDEEQLDVERADELVAELEEFLRRQDPD
jgi:proteasome assembly chaperone (PAC2) family protein